MLARIGLGELLWSLLVLSGYLKAERAAMEGSHYLLSIPNREVREVYRRTFLSWLEERLQRRISRWTPIPLP